MSKKMTMVFIVPGMPFSGGSLTRHSLGGSETAALCMAREMAKFGHDVIVFSNCTEAHTGGPGKYDGVNYRPIQQAENFITQCEHDVLIVERNSKAFMLNHRAKLAILWNHDLAVKPIRGQIHQIMWNVNYITGLSKFHIDQQVDVLQLPKEIMWQTRNGIILDDFKYDTSEKNLKKFMYCSRPERGLENLVMPGGIMEELYKYDPELHLYVAGYDHTTKEMENYYRYLWGRIEELPNCTNLGSLPKHRLYKHYGDTVAYLYPSDFEEISCITAMECMRSKVILIGSEKAAVPETMDGCGVLIKPPVRTKEYMDKFISKVKQVVTDHGYRKMLQDKGFKKSKNMDWSCVAKEWQDKFYSFFEDQTNNEKRLARHFDFYGDRIALLEHSKCKNCENDVLRDVKTKAEDFSSVVDIDNVNNINELLSTANVMKVEFARRVLDTVLAEGKKIKTVVDYGCDYGQYAGALATVFKDINFIGVDISDEKIEKAKKLGIVPNTKFMTLAEFEKANVKADAVLLFDVVDCIPKPWEFVDKVESLLDEDGLVIMSNRYGPWKKIGGDNGMLWHFEGSDIKDMFEKKKAYAINVGYTAKVATGEDIGWHFVVYKKSDAKTGKVDLERKLSIQNPRQTICLSMITKNSEGLLHRALKSVKDIVDDMVIVDTGSTDSTIEIAKKYTSKVFSGSDPLVHGFETPRNETLKHIDTDWILWIDSDEELLMQKNLRKYLKENVFKGYAMRQHHFSAQPANCFKPDMPVRIWRHGIGIQWYGVVHEHVETGMNESVLPSTLLGDIELAHDGYLTEEIRRSRFHRNFDLLCRDRKKYPNRRLGKFLMMRDKVHLMRYELEQNNMNLTPKAAEYAEEVINEFREDFLPMADHMQLDGLSYYSEALRLLNRGAEVTWNIAVAKQNAMMNPKGTLTSRFDTKEDYKTFIESQMDGMFEPHTGKYA